MGPPAETLPSVEREPMPTRWKPTTAVLPSKLRPSGIPTSFQHEYRIDSTSFRRARRAGRISVRTSSIANRRIRLCIPNRFLYFSHAVDAAEHAVDSAYYARLVPGLFMICYTVCRFFRVCSCGFHNLSPRQMRSKGPT